MLRFASILLFLTAPAAAAAQTPSAQSKPAKAQRICREGGEQATGSHIRTGRRCMTAEQWETEDQRNAVKPLTMQVTEGRDGVGKPPR